MSGPNLVYFDLETQKSAAEVGGWQNKRAMKIALGVTYSTRRGTYEIYREEDVYALLQELQRADRVIGYNVIDFDFEVLAPYAVFDLSQVPVLDLMRDVEKTIGLRVGLDAISEQTLGCGKTADGMDALKWWKEGRLAKIAEYCCYDVKATRLVHEFGLRHGCVFYFSKKTQRREKVSVNW
ncbi:MAG TPA: ribonuclease H-like domain-containing protein [Candidatus Methylacidiphilales bacterium]|jgi:DEAD/DEAH box helicase domain-containing protein|nr:ribonuclease H-like domain-containing protein [Candidatus Methylacidiphilales bacterium]